MMTKWPGQDLKIPFYLFAMCQNQSAHVLAYSFFGSGKVEKKDSQEVQVNAHTKIMSIWSKWPRCPSVVGV